MSRTGKNNLHVTIYNGASVLLDELDDLTGVRFDTLYPGGLYGSFSCFVPRRITNAWQVRHGQKLQVYNGLILVWEGRITALAPSVGDGEGVRVTALGYWGDVLMMRKLRKPWVDTRIGQEVWVWAAKDARYTASEICGFDRLNRLRFEPTATQFVNNDLSAFYYYAPTGQTIKRVTCSYDFQEGAQAWELGLNAYESAHENLWLVNTSGTGTQDVTLATPRPIIYFFFNAKATQTPPGDSTIYGQVTNIKVYTETGSINLTEIAKDVRALATEISADEHLIASNTFALEPFVIDPPDTYANILVRAASYGDSSYNAWAVGVRGSHLASDGKPILFVEQQPALTDYDYALRVDDTNVNSGLSFSQNVEDVRNYIIAEYQTIEGFPQFVTPDDDATLKDATSITAYGERHELITVMTTDVTKAKNVARRILAARKDPQWRADGQISVTGSIRDKSGNLVPASQIESGKRFKIENWLNDLSGTGLTFLITSTEYSDSTEVCTLTVGRPDDLATYLARLQAESQ